MILADLGGEVIKLEPPGGDPLREFYPMFASVNRGKKSIVVNLKTAEGQAVLHALAERSDILLESFRPDVTTRLGGDYETLSRINPRLIYCSISGFGQDGPYKNRSGHDINYLAIGGLLSLSVKVDGLPSIPPVLLSDLASGLFAAVAVLAALRGRELTGQGQYIDLSMTDSVVSWLSPELARFSAEGVLPESPTLTHLPHYDVFRTADGKFLTLGIVYEPYFWNRLCGVFGLSDLRGLSTAERIEREKEIRGRLRDILSTKPRDEWERLLTAADVPCGGVRELEELVKDPQFLYRRLFSDLSTEDGGVCRQVALPMKFSAMAEEAQQSPPRLGEQSIAILRELGHSDKKIRHLRRMEIIYSQEKENPRDKQKE